MDWECGECGRAYDEPPERCVCGSGDVRPRDDATPGPVDRTRRALLSGDLDGGLAGDGPVVDLLFRLIIAVSALLVVLLVVAVLL